MTMQAYAAFHVGHKWSAKLALIPKSLFNS